MCSRVAKQVSGSIAPCNVMVVFVKGFRIFVSRQVSQKVEPLSTSARVATIAMVIETRVSPCNNVTLVKLVSLGCVTL